RRDCDGARLDHLFATAPAQQLPDGDHGGRPATWARPAGLRRRGDGSVRDRRLRGRQLLHRRLDPGTRRDDRARGPGNGAGDDLRGRLERDLIGIRPRPADRRLYRLGGWNPGRPDRRRRAGVRPDRAGRARLPRTSPRAVRAVTWPRRAREGNTYDRKQGWPPPGRRSKSENGGSEEPGPRVRWLAPPSRCPKPRA